MEILIITISLLAILILSYALIISKQKKEEERRQRQIELSEREELNRKAEKEAHEYSQKRQAEQIAREERKAQEHERSRQILEEMNKRNEERKTAEIRVLSYEHLKIVVVGVSFANEDGQERQQIISDIKNKKGLFSSGIIELGMQSYEYEGKRAYGIYANDIQFGNVPADLVPFIAENFSSIIGFTGIKFFGGKDGKHHGVEVSLRFDKSKMTEEGKLFISRKPTMGEVKKRGAKRKTFKLTGNRNREMQENICLCSEGNEVSYDYDFDKDKYIASDGVDIGYFPKAAEELLEEGCEVFIERISEDDNGKYSVVVAVYEVIL